jgi:hypothetical protein
MYSIVFFILIFFIIIYIISLFIKYEEKFTNNFDKILDNKCKLLTSNRLNNYLGPWDNSSGDCGEYGCPTESCSFLERDTSVNQQYGTDNYKWTTETSEQTMNEDAGNIVCGSRHNTIHPIHNSTIDCQNVQTNAPDHGQTDVCYQFETPLGEADTTPKRWNRKSYKKLMNEHGHYSWKTKDTLGNETKSDQEMIECRKEPFDCSQSNYYCCMLHGVQDSCYARPINVNDQQIEFVIDQSDNEGLTCRTTDVCGVQTCFEDPEFKRDCWMFNRHDRSWTNNIFDKKILNGVCGHFDADGNRFQDRFYSDGTCQSDTPEFTNEKCAMENTPITCEFLNVNEQMYSKTYHSKLHHNKIECVYETETGDDILIQGWYKSREDASVEQLQSLGYPGYLTDELCPTLTPLSCRNNEHFLKIYDETDTASPECLPCPEGSFRNTSNLVWSAATACTPNVVCPTITECESHTSIVNKSSCTKCLRRLSDNHGNKFEIVHLELESNKDQCVVIDDRECEKEDNGEYKVCDPELVKSFGDNLFCDNCMDGYKLDDSNGTVQCRKTIDCGDPIQKNCLDDDKLYFDTYTYNNQDDEFSSCVWSQVDNPGYVTPNCVTECDEGKYKSRLNNDGSDDLHCSSVLSDF